MEHQRKKEVVQRLFLKVLNWLLFEACEARYQREMNKEEKIEISSIKEMEEQICGKLYKGMNGAKDSFETYVSLEENDKNADQRYDLRSDIVSILLETFTLISCFHSDEQDKVGDIFMKAMHEFYYGPDPLDEIEEIHKTHSLIDLKDKKAIYNDMKSKNLLGNSGPGGLFGCTPEIANVLYVYNGCVYYKPCDYKPISEYTLRNVPKWFAKKYAQAIADYLCSE